MRQEGSQTIEAVGPFGVSAAEPVVNGEQALELKSRRAARAIAGPADQAGPLEHLEVLGDGGLVSVDAAASSTTPASPAPRRSRIARRVGSARAAKARLSGSFCRHYREVI